MRIRKGLYLILLLCLAGTARAQESYTDNSYRAWEKKPWHKEYTKKDRLTEDTFRLYSVLFVFATDSFYRDMTADLDSLGAWLQENPAICIEVGVHVSRCNPEYSRLYSRRRAENVRKYLLAEGVAPERVTAVGYECKHPLIPEDVIRQQSTEAERMNAERINRRIEIRILKQ